MRKKTLDPFTFMWEDLNLSFSLPYHLVWFKKKHALSGTAISGHFLKYGSFTLNEEYLSKIPFI